jgi:hypothetical protein
VRIEYHLGIDPITAYSRDLPAGLYSRAGAAFLARLLAEELVGSGLVERCRVGLFDDDGSTIVALEVSSRPDGVEVGARTGKPGPRCVECFSRVKRGKPCPTCGGRASFDGGLLGGDVLEAAGG